MKQRTLARQLHLRLRFGIFPKLRRRGLFLLGGIAVGVVAVLMAALADQAQALFALVDHQWSYAPLIITPCGFALSGWLTSRFLLPRRAAAFHR